MTDIAKPRPTSKAPLMAMLVRPQSRWQHRGRFLMIAVGLAVCGVAIAAQDLTISTIFRQVHLPGDLAKAINLSEVFGHSIGAAAILGSVWWLSPRKPTLWAAILVTLASGLCSNGLKSCFVRIRPHSVEKIRVLEAGSATQVQPRVPADNGPALEPVPASIFDSRQRSFPSGHTATAWGLAIGLSWVFPRGWLLFAGFATLASVQRLTSGAHYPTDVLAGAAIAFVAAAILFPANSQSGAATVSRECPSRENDG